MSGGNGVQVPFAQVADIRFAPGPAMIRSEDGSPERPRLRHEVGGCVTEARQVVARLVRSASGASVAADGSHALEHMLESVAHLLGQGPDALVAGELESFHRIQRRYHAFTWDIRGIDHHVAREQ